MSSKAHDKKKKKGGGGGGGGVFDFLAGGSSSKGAAAAPLASPGGGLGRGDAGVEGDGVGRMVVVVLGSVARACVLCFGRGRVVGVGGA